MKFLFLFLHLFFLAAAGSWGVEVSTEAGKGFLPQDVEEALEQGEALYAQGRYREALPSFRYASTRLPSEVRARAGLALTLEALGDFRSALPLWIAWDAEQSSQNPEALYFLGRHHLMEGRYDSAEEVLKRLTSGLTDASSRVENLVFMRAGSVLLAVAQHLGGRHADSIANLDHLESDLSASIPFAHSLAGRDYERLERLDKALDRLRAGLSKDANLLESRRLLSRTLARVGDLDAAYIEGRKYLQAAKDPDFEKDFKQYAKRTTKSPDVLLKTQDSGFAQSWPKTVDFQLSGARGKTISVGLFASSIGEVPALSELSVMAAAPFNLTLADGSILERGKTDELWRVLHVTTPTAAIVVLHGNREVIRSADSLRFKTLKPEAGGFLLKNARLTGEPLSLRPDLQLRGDISVVSSPYGFHLINDVALEDYLLGVLPAEIGPNSPPEAFKAQAVLARSYALWRMESAAAHPLLAGAPGRVSPETETMGLKLCDSVHCQVYKGVLSEIKAAGEAVAATASQVLRRKGQTFQIWYHASCGGLLRDIPAWDAPLDRKRMVLPASFGPRQMVLFYELAPFWDEGQEWCFEKHPRFSWVRLVEREDLERQTRVEYPKVGRLKNVILESRDEDGRIVSVRLAGTRGHRVIEEEYPIRRALAPGALRSTLFSMIPLRHRNDWKMLLFIGRGYGHGHGMCQVGAIRQAKENKDYREILKFYYPDSELVK